MPASSSSPIHPVLDHLACAVDANQLAGTGLLAALARVADPRKRRGVRHQIGAILAVAVIDHCAGVVLGQLEVASKTNEITQFTSSCNEQTVLGFTPWETAAPEWSPRAEG
jgi:hypothetical protein